jgi:hypothetical protein
MKLTLLALATSLSMALATVPEISANSAMGKSLISKARRLDEGDDDNYSMTWVTGYSLKYQGCNTIAQWNGDADEDNDVKVASKRLVRFRLCPADTCTATSGGGCDSGYGEYIIDMDTFMASYFTGKQTQIEYDCEYMLAYNCDCDNDDAKDDGFDEEYCEYDCYNDAGMTQCIDNNPYSDDEEEEGQFQLEDYMECAELEIDDDNRRKLEDGDDEEVKYYVGPTCADQGGTIKLGMFTDESCTNKATDVTFYELMGFTLPYSGEEETLIDMECMDCVTKQEVNNEDDGNNNNGDDGEAAEVNEMCAAIYTAAGKCEANLPEGMVYYPITNACTYMEGVSMVRENGIINTESSRSNAVATAFIVIFAMAFASMAFYVWYLRTRLGVKKNTLL